MKEQIKKILGRWQRKRKRYYNVVFIATCDKGQMTGSVPIVVSGAINRKKTTDWIVENEKGLGVRDVVIINWIELSIQDYNDWIK